MAQTKTVNLRIVETSDVHGYFFPYDFVNRKPLEGTLMRINTYVNNLRNQYGQTFVIVTHDEGLANITDRTIKMRDGMLELSTLGSTGEGNDVTDVLHTGDEQDKALEAETETGMGA